jgi:hypothetical protein
MNITVRFDRFCAAIRRLIRRWRYGPDTDCSKCGQRMNWAKGCGPNRTQCARCWYGRNDATATKTAIDVAQLRRFGQWKAAHGIDTMEPNMACPCGSGRKWKRCHGQTMKG